jgi:Uma2 family endonuclease
MFQRKEESHLFLPHDGEVMSIHEFEDLIEQRPDVRYEYRQGRAWAMAGGSANHSRLIGKCYRLLEEQLTSGPCHAFFEMYVHINNDYRLLPDVVVTCNLADYRDDSTLIYSPHIIVEVLSPSTERKDRGEKFEAYRQLASLQEYVLIQQKKAVGEVYRKAADWRPHLFGSGDEIELASLDIFFSLDELYAALV